MAAVTMQDKNIDRKTIECYITFVLCVKVFLYEEAFINDRFGNLTKLYNQRNVIYSWGWGCLFRWKHKTVSPFE